ncbi:MAG TPA: histidine--tRNA ligase [candidate division Zixibacteria bacterium]|nr:histidine--tRNA ligase [candidate division Zixibacteria bacterium]
MKIEPRLYRGMRDILPADMLIREELLADVRETFRLWGFAPLATPAIEFRDILAGKYGESADRLIYNIEHKDGIALRYDLTVPLARVVAMNRNDLPTPFKRYQIQEVWRAERAQPRQGRFREFIQCDVDIVGTDSLIADAEVLALSIDLLGRLGFPGAITRINHRAVLRGLMEVCGFKPEEEMDVCRIIDKLDKIGEDGVREELAECGFAAENIDMLMKTILSGDGTGAMLDEVESKFHDNKRIAKGISDLKRVLNFAESFGVQPESVRFDLALSRGLDYYTGTIFESVVPELPHIGSLTGGGRYDELIGLFSKSPIPAVGITIGIDRIITALLDAGKVEHCKTPTRVLVTIFDESLAEKSIDLARKLRAEGVACEVHLEPVKLKKQFEYADAQGIPFVVILGEDEIAHGLYSLKDMRAGEQVELDFESLIRKVVD